MARDHVLLKVWERGAGLTMACGSAACATVAAGVRLRKIARQADVHLPGGVLSINWDEANDHVMMQGPVAFHHGGQLRIEDHSVTIMA